MMLEYGHNSYIEGIEEADNIVMDLYDGEEELSVWNSLTVPNKERLIRYATRKIDKLLFIGRKYIESGTSLSFPRIIHGDIVDIPEDIKLAVIVLALNRYIYGKQDDEYNQLRENGISDYKISDASVSFEDTSVIHRVPRYIIDEYLINWVYY